MGNSSSSGRGHHDESVDFGFLSPQGVYTGPKDWNQAVVTQLICARRLAPFYRPLEDYNDNWDDDQILAARKDLPSSGDNLETVTRIEATAQFHTSAKASKRPGALKEPSKPEAAVYRGAVECPICFLYYPPNINHSRCCDQAICTECFVQIKRSEPTTTHVVSEPAACPYCVQENFGIVYTPPPWRAGLGSENSIFAEPSKSPQSAESSSYPTHKRRQKSFGADSPEVVTTDQIRPDWEAKLAAVRAAVARRANRRIIMRQVGDRLIPVGITSGRVHALSPEEAQAEGVDNGGSRRARRRLQAPNQNFEQFVGLGGQDLEELMIMEAMRLSLLDHEEHQRKEAEEKKKQEATASESSVATTSGPSTSTLTPSSGNITSYSPSTSPSAPVHGDSLHVNKDLLPTPIGLSHTPPRPAACLSQRRSPSPAPYSTLTAALSTTSTASAILAGSVSTSSSISNGEANTVSSIPKADTPPRTSGDSPRSPMYDTLPSSAESLLAHEPLLGSRATHEEATI